MAQVIRLLAVAHPTWHNLVPTGAVPVSAVPDHLLLESGEAFASMPKMMARARPG